MTRLTRAIMRVEGYASLCMISSYEIVAYFTAVAQQKLMRIGNEFAPGVI